MQRERRRDPYPWTWEIPLAGVLVVVLVLAVSVQLGRSLANAIAGAGWTWPDSSAGAGTSPLGTSFWSSIPRVVAGDSVAGLAAPVHADVAGTGLLWASLLLFLTAACCVLGLVGHRLLRRWGPGRMRGMATPMEAEQLLGLSRLRSVVGVVRPDLTTDRSKRHRRRST